MRENFTSTGFSIGIEEELMIVHGESFELTNAIGQLLEGDVTGDVKPELMESVCEIATAPCANTAEAGEELRRLRSAIRRVARTKGLDIGSAGTHPYALWEEQRIVAEPRYRELVEALRFVARQELIFGLHVHVGLDDPDKAVFVANGMRVHVPVLLALSCNSPFWRADATGLQSTRTPVFRQFPRVGIPPAYRDWADYERRIRFMVDSGVMEDATYLWYDVRVHPRFGTVEVRACDAQTRVEHTLGIAALIQAMVRELAEHYESGQPLSDYPYEMLDENKFLAARHGLDGELVDLPVDRRVGTKELARCLVDRLRGHAQDLGSADDLAAVDDLLARGNGAHRQRVVYEANRDLHEVMSEIVGATAPDGG